MTTQTKDAVIVTIVMIGGVAMLAGDLHRTILQVVWPYVEAFYEYLAR